ncbi:MAG: hypothetical protein QOE03_745 [Micromonosporaceae bacterium]|nr:hypothetical protein [Micromonosporaceae bacterium]
MQFRILGPLEVSADGAALDLGGVRQRRILAALLLHPNRVVGLAELVEAAWDDDPPETARRQVQNRVAELRALLTRYGGFIDTEDAGYRLRIGAGELDALRFDELVVEGRAAADPAILRQALALWRGPALAGLTGSRPTRSPRPGPPPAGPPRPGPPPVRSRLAGAAAALDERRLAVYEECFELELAAGRHADLVEEMTGLLAAHPLRERLVGQVMTALHGSGRTADALAVYRALAGQLADELGIDPGTDLRRRYEGLLAGDGQPTRPAQLPADVAGFTGRHADQARLDKLAAAEHVGLTVVISAIAGTAGVGKTALAVHWAHRVRDRFADGQLYVNLRGHALTPPLRPIDALGGFLRALGVAAERVPTDTDEAAALYREVLTDKRVLVVLDNAASADQVRPLLPANPDCLVLVTSRNTLAGLVERDGARRLTLAVLAPADAYALLARTIGAARVAAEPDAAVDLARLCAYLPLALRIAAANMSDVDTIAGYAARLAAGNRLAALTVDGDERAAVRAAFDLSYGAQPEPARRLFRLFGLVPGPDVTAAAAAALADVGVDEAADGLDRLTAAHLIERDHDRYTCHDLLRLYARELAAADATGPAAAQRLHDFYLGAARVAADLIYPGVLHLPLPARMGAGRPPVSLETAERASAWLDAERPNLVAAVLHAAEHGPRPAAWLLADALRGYLFVRGHIVDLADCARAALGAAHRDGELNPQVIAYIGLASICLEQSRYPEAIDQLSGALELARRTGWREAQAGALGYLGTAHLMVGRPGRASGYLIEALALHGELGWTSGQANDLFYLGLVHWEMGRLDDAVDSYRRALSLYETIGSTHGQALARANLGDVYHALGLLDAAFEHLDWALTRYRESENRDGEADVLRILAAVHRSAGDHVKAVETVDAALTLAREIGSRRYEAFALSLLATLDGDKGRHGAARDHAERALSVARSSGDRYPEVQAMIGLAAAYAGLGRYDDAQRWADRAVTGAVESEYRLLERRARASLDEIRLDRDR